jgi:hypothetical protein
MPRPTKRAVASRQVGAQAVLKRRRITALEELEATPNGSSKDSSAPRVLHVEIQLDGLSNDATEGSESESDAQSEGILSEEEDEYPIGQPQSGWKEAEKSLYGYSKTRVYKQKISYHKNKEEIKTRQDEAKAVRAGIPVIQQAKPLWGDISRMFSFSSSIHASTHVAPAEFQPLHYDNWTASVLMIVPEYGSLELSLVRPYAPPNFEEAFLNCQSFETEARELGIWLKAQKGRVTGDWFMRIECL